MTESEAQNVYRGVMLVFLAVIIFCMAICMKDMIHYCICRETSLAIKQGGFMVVMMIAMFNQALNVKKAF